MQHNIDLTSDGLIDKPNPPQGPVEVVENSASCIHVKWRPPKDDGGSQLQGYSLERQQVGRNTWAKLGQIPSATAAYKDTKVEHGRKYCYRIRAVNQEGLSELLKTEDIMAGIKGELICAECIARSTRGRTIHQIAQNLLTADSHPKDLTSSGVVLFSTIHLLADQWRPVSGPLCLLAGDTVGLLWLTLPLIQSIQPCHIMG